jgi:UDP-N-acetylmuramoylalanine--D-glutamate ligase
MKIAIIGYGIEGKSSYQYFSKSPSNQVEIRDQNDKLELKPGIESKLGQKYLDDLNSFDLVVRSSGIQPEIILDRYPDLRHGLSSQLNEFLSVCPSKKIIGVTGTKGKGTTSTLIAQMLEKAGKSTVLGGNIGLPMLDMLDRINGDTYVVLELSSFQLVDLSEPSPHWAVCLMVVPEHLNWHPDLAAYLEAKSKLFENQTHEDVAIYFSGSDYAKQIASKSSGKQIAYFSEDSAEGASLKDNQLIIAGQVICQDSEVKLLGQHNLQNVCAAITVLWQITKDVQAIRTVVTSFSGLEHRLEFVDEVNSVKFYDDSFGTTPETAIVAIAAINQPKVLIAGGSDKGADYSAMVNAIITGNVKHVICIGNTGVTIAGLLEKTEIPYTLLGIDEANIEDIVRQALNRAEPGDAVLLSTGSASFDMFANYKDRGDSFKKAVRLLATTA